MTVVKMCGITNRDDALCAVDAGADLLGFIFYPKSPRAVTVEQAAEIVAAARRRSPAVGTVGVFVNEAPEDILRALDAAGIDYAQLSGDEPAESILALQGRAYKALRAIPTDLTAFIPSLHAPLSTLHAAMPDLLLDANHPALYGGSGTRADESLAATLARRYRLLLAGGLTPDNIADAIRAVQPWGVDVSSGVEAAPGRKDHATVRTFVAAAKAT